MLAPRNRLLFWFALIGLPFSVLAGAHPPTLIISVAIITGLFCVVIVDAWLSRRLFTGISLGAPPVSRLAVDKDGHIELRLQTQSRKARTLRIALPLPAGFSSPCEELDVVVPEATEWSKFLWLCRPEKRGNFSLSSVYLESPSPLGFWSARKVLPLQTELRVYPNLQKEHKSLSLMFRGTFGTHTQRQIGRGREFEKLRDYVPGDGSEDIHWKATARRGRPVTKVFQIERTQEVYVALDTSRLSARENSVEYHISTALLMGIATEQQGDLFGLLSFSDHVDSFVRARSGTAHYQACRDAIYALQPKEVNPDFDEVCSFIRLRLRRRALVIILTALDDPVLSENFIRNIDLIARQHVVIVGMIKQAGIAPMFTDSDLSSADELYDQLGGHLRWHNLMEVSGHLQRRGVKLAVFDGERMALQMISEYLTVKKRQLL